MSWYLSEDEKREAMRAYRGGEPVAVIATRFGISVNALCALAQRRGLRRRKLRSDAGSHKPLGEPKWK